MAKSVKNSKSSSRNILSKLRDSESSASIVFGAIVVVVVGILLFNYSRSNRQALLSEKGATTETGELSATNMRLPNTYTVVSGDHLWKIAEKFYGSGYNWVDIAAENNLKEEDGLRIGMILAIPASPQKSPTPISTDVIITAYVPPQPISGTSYQVVPGDTLWGIAVRAYGDGYKWTSILKANTQLIRNANKIDVGWTLNLPR